MKVTENFDIPGDCFLLFENSIGINYQIQLDFHRGEYVMYQIRNDSYIEVASKMIDEFLEEGEWNFHDMIIISIDGKWFVFQKIRPLKIIDKFHKKQIVIDNKYIKFKDRANGFTALKKGFKIKPLNKYNDVIIKLFGEFWIAKRVNI